MPKSNTIYIKPDELEFFNPSKQISITEYSSNLGNCSIATAIINGFYPSNTSWAFNIEGVQCYVVTAGTGSVLYPDGQEFDLFAGVLIKIPANQSYRTFGKNLNLVLLSNPPFNPDKHKIK